MILNLIPSHDVDLNDKSDFHFVSEKEKDRKCLNWITTSFIVVTSMLCICIPNGFHNITFTSELFSNLLPPSSLIPPLSSRRHIENSMPNGVIQRRVPDVIIQHFITHRRSHFDYGFGSKRFYFFHSGFTDIQQPPIWVPFPRIAVFHFQIDSNAYTIDTHC